MKLVLTSAHLYLNANFCINIPRYIFEVNFMSHGFLNVTLVLVRLNALFGCSPSTSLHRRDSVKDLNQLIRCLALCCKLRAFISLFIIQ